MMTKLLLLPGHMCDAAVWATIAPSLSDVADCVVGDVGRQDSIGAIAAALLAEHEGCLAVAGFSFGGFVALQMARQAPERLKGIALIGTVATALPDEQRAERLRRVELAEREGVEAYVASLMPVYVHPDHLFDPALAGTIAGMARRIGLDTLRRQVAANIGRPDARPLLNGLRVPTMVLCGASDAVCPPAAHRSIAEACPSATLEEVPVSGHFVTLEQPGAVVSAMRRWLIRVAPACQT